MIKVCQARNLTQYGSMRLPMATKKSYVRAVFVDKPYDVFRSALLDAVSARLQLISACSAKELDVKYMQTMSLVEECTGLLLTDLRSTYDDSHTVAGHLRFKGTDQRRKQLSDLIVNWEMDQQWRLQEALKGVQIARGRKEWEQKTRKVEPEPVPEPEPEEKEEEQTKYPKITKARKQNNFMQTSDSKKTKPGCQTNFYGKKSKEKRERKQQEKKERIHGKV